MLSLEYKYDGRLSKDGLSLRTESSIDPRDYEDTLQDLSNRYNADFYLGAEVFRQSGSKDYSVELTSDELKTLKSGKGQKKLSSWAYQRSFFCHECGA